MSTEYAAWMANEGLMNAIGELSHTLHGPAGIIDERSGPKIMHVADDDDGFALMDGYVVSGVYIVDHGSAAEDGLFFTSSQVERMRKAIAAIESALTTAAGGGGE